MFTCMLHSDTYAGICRLSFEGFRRSSVACCSVPEASLTLRVQGLWFGAYSYTKE